MYGLRPKSLDGRLVERLKGYPWPGNVRELRNIIERMVIASPGDVLGPGDLPSLAETAALAPAGLSGTETYEEFKATSERNFIVRRLEANNFNISKTAEDLGIQRSNLYKKIQKLGIEPREKP
jgi:two-component system nitrogen regulation response regulator NtrX